MSFCDGFRHREKLIFEGLKKPSSTLLAFNHAMAGFEFIAKHKVLNILCNYFLLQKGLIYLLSGFTSSL
jgi:hypothetical protein